MSKYFIIIYPNRQDKNYWINISPLCKNKVSSSNNNDSYSDPFQINNNFTLFFYQTRGQVTEKSLKEFFNSNQIGSKDEIIIFGHK